MLLALITLAAFALRTLGIAQLGELEYDEAFSWALGSRPPLDILSYVVGYETHSPAFYWLLHGWIAAVGDSEPALRMIAVLPSTLGVAVLGSAVTRAAGARAGAVAALALALAPIDVFYARYVRMYAFASLAMSALIATVVWSAKRPLPPPGGFGGLPPPDSQRRVRGRGRPSSPAPNLNTVRAVVAAVGLTGTATFYYAGFGLLGAGAGLGLGALGWRFSAGLVLVCGALGGAWLALAGGVRTNLVTTSIGPRGDFAALYQLLGDGLGALAFPFGPASWAAGLIAVAAAVVLVQWRRMPAALAAAALGGLLVPTALAATLGWFGRPFFPRYVLVAIPFAAALIGLAGSRLPRSVAALALLVLVPGALWSIRPNYGYDCCDYQEMVAALRSQVGAGDTVVLHNPLQEVLYRRYAADLPAGVTLTSETGFAADEARARLVSLARTHSRFWLIESAPDWVDPAAVALGWLDSNLYPVAQQRFHNALLRLYLADGIQPPQEFRPIQGQLLDVQLEAVGLDRWTLAAGSDARLTLLASAGSSAGADLVRGNAPEPPGRPAKVSARLIAPDGANVWQADRPLARVDDRPGVRMGLTVPAKAMAGAYALELVVYEEGRLPAGGSGITRSSDPTRVGLVEVLAPRSASPADRPPE